MFLLFLFFHFKKILVVIHLDLFNKFVTPILMYGSKNWTLFEIL